jgi:hypothetical protein
MLAGQTIQIRAYHADGTCYRRWMAIVEAIEDDVVVVVVPVGHRVDGLHRTWFSEVAIRAYYWTNKDYSLLEIYTGDGVLREIFVNINGPTEIDVDGLRYVDYELDVRYVPPGPAVMIDEDEFRAAARAYGYSAKFQEACYRTAHEALQIAERWVARGMPSIGR